MPATTDDVRDILDRVRRWAPADRIRLAREILETLEPSEVSEPRRASPPEKLFGILKTDAPPPSDKQVREILIEERMRKYG